MSVKESPYVNQSQSVDPPQATQKPGAAAADDAGGIVWISAWSDPLIDRLGYDPRSSYVEMFWLSVLGPSTVWLLRHCVGLLDSTPAGTELDLAVVARQLGLGHRGGKNSPMSRSILRACRFGAARPAGRDQLEVRRRLPPLNRAQIQRLPETAQRRHQTFAERSGPGAGIPDRSRARRLALGLVECGDAFDAAELQLDRWSFTPEVAAEAVRWAWDQHHRADASPDAAA